MGVEKSGGECVGMEKCGCGVVGVCGCVVMCVGVAMYLLHICREVGVSVGLCVWVWRSVGMSTCGMYIYLYLLCSI